MAGAQDVLIPVAVISGAHGVRGEVRVKSFTQDPASVFAYGPLLGADGEVILTPVQVRAAKDHYIVRAREVRSKEQWDSLRGAKLHVLRSTLPPAGPDEFYVEDLAGLTVISRTAGPGAIVRRVVNFGAGDLLEIDVPGLSRTVLVPFSLAEIEAIDLASGRIDIPDLSIWIDSSSPD